MHPLYNFGVRLYVTGIHVASIWNFKAKQWVKGRNYWIEDLGRASGGFKDHVVWVHCASLGEFEMARPLMEKIKRERHDVSILLTFFSPSGYEIRKNWRDADFVMYLPADTPTNARAFVKMASPKQAIFVKYEYWLNYLQALHEKKIDTYMVCSVFRKDQSFFKWYGKPFRHALTHFKRIFVQDQDSADLARELGVNAEVSGDMRYDRVMTHAAHSQNIPGMDRFTLHNFTVVAGSTWPQEEKIICEWINAEATNVKLVIAPHDISEDHLASIEKKLTVPNIRFSKLTDNTSSARVVIVDNIGMLSTLYKYGDVAVVGGGFTGALHNILEPAVYGIPVLFGPRHKRFHEARTLILAKGAFTFSDTAEFKQRMQVLKDELTRKTSGACNKKVVEEHAGATDAIFHQIFE